MPRLDFEVSYKGTISEGTETWGVSLSGVSLTVGNVGLGVSW